MVWAEMAKERSFSMCNLPLAVARNLFLPQGRIYRLCSVALLPAYDWIYVFDSSSKSPPKDCCCTVEVILIYITEDSWGTLAGLSSFILLPDRLYSFIAQVNAQLG